jgi:hypothetical protein
MQTRAGSAALVGRWKRSATVTVATFAMVLAAGAACASGDESLNAEASQADQVDLPFDLANSSWQAAAAGSDLVFVDTGERAEGAPRSAMVRRRDGSFAPLPAIPFPGDIAIASAGETVVVGGYECVQADCTVAALAFAQLSADQSTWRRLSAPDVRLTDDAEYSAMTGRQEHALFTIGQGSYAVSSTGEVVQIPEWPPSDAEASFSCLTNNSLVMVGGRGVPGSELGGMLSVVELAGDTWVLELSDLKRGWYSLGAIPAGILTSYGALCGPSKFSFQNGDQAAELDVNSGKWTTRPSNLTALLGNPVIIPAFGTVAVDSGTASTYVVNNGTVLAQVGSGAWSDTGQLGQQIYDTGDGVISYDRKSGEFKLVGPHR